MKIKLTEKLKMDVFVGELEPGDGFLYKEKAHIKSERPAWWEDDYFYVPAFNLHEGRIETLHPETKVRRSEISVEYTV